MSENPDVLRMLINAGADLEARDVYGQTALMNAAGRNSRNAPLFPPANPEMLRVLVDAGADLEARDIFGRTALLHAVGFTDDPDVIGVLLDAGADATVRNGNGETAFSIASGRDVLRGTDVYWRLNDARFR